MVKKPVSKGRGFFDIYCLMIIASSSVLQNEPAVFLDRHI